MSTWVKSKEHALRCLWGNLTPTFVNYLLSPLCRLAAIITMTVGSTRFTSSMGNLIQTPLFPCEVKLKFNQSWQRKIHIFSSTDINLCSWQEWTLCIYTTIKKDVERKKKIIMCYETFKSNPYQRILIYTFCLPISVTMVKTKDNLSQAFPLGKLYHYHMCCH